MAGGKKTFKIVFTFCRIELMELSIIIVSWNLKEALRRCLRSIYSNTKNIGFEIFVMDNNSSDNSQTMVKEEFPLVNIISNSVNAGFANACNQGILSSSGKYILLLNQDTEVLPDTIATLLDFIKTRNDVGIIAPKLIFPDGTLQFSCHHFPNIFTDLMESTFLSKLFPKSKFFNWFEMGRWSHDRLSEVDQPMGACLMIRRELIEEIGYLDERFFLFYEDIDFCRRAKKAGKKIIFYPGVKLIHRTIISGKNSYERVLNLRIKSKKLFFIKHYTPISLLFLIFNLVINSILVFAILPIFNILMHSSLDLPLFKKIVAVSWKQYLARN